MSFQRSHEPIVWSLFGGGGVVAAFLLPALILVTGIMAPAGLLDGDALSYARVLAFSQHWLGKLCWLTVISLPMWHAMHRIYHGLHDLKVGARGLFFVLCYGFALVVTIATGTLLLAI
ncbi:fumarate reductase subunit FrdD [Corallincola luteus]|uniref:Fumarate reductase subunit D n=1 Tax=Corallincola luteus TaxID=1775177 RepID=A0ABY2ANX7_9GAMM|nr:fumarate reductase subunit FrdD [Corallincola luteus]TCI04621.1 fumarate reductase subunit FrdD [Corallincola luteus]